MGEFIVEDSTLHPPTPPSPFLTLLDLRELCILAKALNIQFSLIYPPPKSICNIRQ